jgi:hypothetical protein
MANQVIIKKDQKIKGTFKVSIFNENGTPVLNGWQEFNVGEDKVWDPGRYGAPITSFYIAKGIGPHKDNQFVAYAVKVEFNKDVDDATITLGIREVAGINGGSGCYYFTASGDGVTCKIVTDGKPVSGTELPDRCSIG